MNFNRVLHYKPSILGYHYFWKHQQYSSGQLLERNNLNGQSLQSPLSAVCCEPPVESWRASFSIRSDWNTSPRNESDDSYQPVIMQIPLSRKTSRVRTRNCYCFIWHLLFVCSKLSLLKNFHPWRKPPQNWRLQLYILCWTSFHSGWNASTELKTTENATLHAANGGFGGWECQKTRKCLYLFNGSSHSWPFMVLIKITI